MTEKNNRKYGVARPLDGSSPEDFLKRQRQDAINCLQKKQFSEMAITCNESLNATDDPNEQLEFFKLRGVAYGGLGMPEEARSSFLEALRIDPKDGFTLANYITSCLDCGDSQAAIDGVSKFYSGLDGMSKGIVIDSLIEALECKTIEISALPPEVIDTISKKIPKLA